MIKPRGYPFLFFGHDPPASTDTSTLYGLLFAEDIPFYAGRHHELEKAFRERLARGGLDGEVSFDPTNARVAAVRVSLAAADARKHVAVAMLAVHGVHALAECVCVSSRGVGASKWDAQSREAQSEPSAALLSLEAATSADDARLTKVAPAARPRPFTVTPRKSLPVASAPVLATLGDSYEGAQALRGGLGIAVDPSGEVAYWVRRGVVFCLRLGDPPEVAADLLGFPSRLTGPSSATVGVIDADRLVVTVGSMLMMLARDHGLFRPVAAVALAGQSFHATAGLPGQRLAIVGSAYGPDPATLQIFAAVGRRWVSLARDTIDADTFGMKSELSGLEPAERGGRAYVEAEFASKGRALKKKGWAELGDLPSAPPDEPASDAVCEPDFPVGASTARRLPDGGWLAIFPRVAPPDEGRVRPVRREVVRVRPDGTEEPYALPPGAYVSLALSPDHRRFLAVGGHEGPSLVAAVEGGEKWDYFDQNAAPSVGAFLDDEHLLLRGQVLHLPSQSVVQRLPAPYPVALEVDRAQAIAVSLLPDGTVEWVRWAEGRVQGAGVRECASATNLRSLGGRVQAMSGGLWRSLETLAG